VFGVFLHNLPALLPITDNLNNEACTSEMSRVQPPQKYHNRKLETEISTGLEIAKTSKLARDEHFQIDTNKS
jgi:hypothetical protein